MKAFLKVGVGLCLFWLFYIVNGILYKYFNETTSTFITILSLLLWILSINFIVKSYITSVVIFSVKSAAYTFLNFSIYTLLYFLIFGILNLFCGASIINNWHKLLSINILLTTFLATYFEELIFRFYILAALISERINIHIAVLLSSTVFTLIHITQYNLSESIIIFLISIILCLLFISTKNLGAAWGFHFANNIFYKYWEINDRNIKSPTDDNYLMEIVFYITIIIAIFIYSYYKNKFKNPITIFSHN